VHGGSGISHGVIEQLRHGRPQSGFLELVHRLDRDTSGVLLLAKKRSALTALHEAAAKRARAEVLSGAGLRPMAQCKAKRQTGAQQIRTGFGRAPRQRRKDGDGMASHTVFRLKQHWREFSLLEAELKTGRTHQIRVHLAHLGYPIAGDDKYGDFAHNKTLAKQGLKRMFLHAYKVVIEHPAAVRK